MQELKELTIYSERMPSDLSPNDKIHFILSEDKNLLRIETICYDGAKSTENFILLRRNNITEELFKAVLSLSDK